jgi:hypothetical protein
MAMDNIRLTGSRLSVFNYLMQVIKMEKRSILGVTLIIGIVVVFSLMILTTNNVPPTTVTNQTLNPITTSEVQSEVMGRLSHTINLDTPVLSKVDKILIYKTILPQFTRQDILMYGEKFNMSADDDIKGGDEGYGRASKDRKIHLYLTNTGWIEYINSNRAHTINPIDIPGNLPSDDEAVKSATKFLKDHVLLPEGAEFRKTSHGRILGTAEDGTSIVVWEDIQVWYGRKLDGKTVEGTQLMLAIGADGTPIEFFTNWREYEPYKEYPLITPQDAFDKLKAKGVPVGMNNPESIVSIDDVRLAYKTKAGAYSEEYLEPVWVFKGYVVVDGKAADFVETDIPALTDEAVKSLSSS